MTASNEVKSEVALVTEVTTPTAPLAPVVPAGDAPNEMHEEFDFSSIDKSFDGEDADDAPAPTKSGESPPPAVTTEQSAVTPASTVTPAVTSAPVITTPAAPVTPPKVEVPAPVVNQPKTLVPEGINLFSPTVPAPSQPPVQPVVPGAAQPEITPAATAAPTAPPADDMNALREKYVKDIEPMYAITEEQARALVVEPEKVLPALLAKHHVDVLTAAVNGIMAQLPQILDNYQEQTRARSRMNAQFFETWPQLAKTEFVPIVKNHIRAYAQLNPQAKWEDVVREAGAMALVALRLPFPGMPSPTQPAPVINPPITPLNPGGGAAPIRASSGNWAENFAGELLSEDILPDAD